MHYYWVVYYRHSKWSLCLIKQAPSIEGVEVYLDFLTYLVPRLQCLLRFTVRPRSLAKGLLLPLGYDAGWVSELIWTLWRRNTLFRFSLFWDVTRLRLVIIRRRFGTTCLSHFQGPGSPRRMAVCPETSVNNYQSLPRRSYLHRCGSLKSLKKSLALPEDYITHSVVMYEWMRLLCTGHRGRSGVVATTVATWLLSWAGVSRH